MQKDHHLHFPCQSCQGEIAFSIFDLDKHKGKLSCPQCSLVYDFNDEVLQRQLRKFTDLCEQIQDSEEILSTASIGVFIGDKEVKVPFKILLSRLNSKLDLKMGDKTLTISFRIEPTRKK